MLSCAVGAASALKFRAILTLDAVEVVGAELDGDAVARHVDEERARAVPRARPHAERHAVGAQHARERGEVGRVEDLAVVEVEREGT